MHRWLRSMFRWLLLLPSRTATRPRKERRRPLAAPFGSLSLVGGTAVSTPRKRKTKRTTIGRAGTSNRWNADLAFPLVAQFQEEQPQGSDKALAAFMHEATGIPTAESTARRWRNLYEDQPQPAVGQ